VLLPLLKSQTRLERHEAAVALARADLYPALSYSQRHQLDIALEEVREAMMSANDRAGAHLGWALLCEQRGLYPEAIAAYETAIRVEPGRAGARPNLAALLEQLAEAERGRVAPEIVQQRLARAQQLRREELPLLERDAALVPDNPYLQYRLGLAYYLDGQLDRALKQLQRAVQLQPDEPGFREALELLQAKLAESPDTR